MPVSPRVPDVTIASVSVLLRRIDDAKGISAEWGRCLVARLVPPKLSGSDSTGQAGSSTTRQPSSGITSPCQMNTV
jgi:hypothetical protein